MIIGHHIIWSCYGFWLPNDPRGSWSDFVRSWDLFRYGPATKTISRRSMAGEAHGVTLRQCAKRALKHPPVRLTGVQARAVARGIRKAIADGGYVMHALAILRDHVHAVVARHGRDGARIRDGLKAAATRQMNAEDVNPKPGDSPWARKGWCVFIDSAADMARAIDYVNENPLKEGLPAQRWSFVTPFSGGRQPALRNTGADAPR